MPVCQHCQQKWSWTYTFKKLFTFKNHMLCPHCQHHQFITAKSRRKVSLIALLPLMWILLSAIGVSASTIIILELLTFPIVLVIMPTRYELSNQEEPLW
ncbi:TIGR04104 family putative zinc finger protein [Bacillus sp. FJAT-42315]|uniref:TIGR04104 family putative zinc finger protein n=1 Tax=Bacillus sp. FJAT-42315 TaxID=2014077 RepID=UPI000C24E51C|nr:TIGR04104 family putative zinc finger protein [Bacillus sp. FJAT-42315]